MRIPRPKSRLGWAILAVLASVAVWLIVSAGVAYRLTRRAAPQRAEPVPAIAWGRIKPLRLATRDGQDIGAWFIDGRADRPVVLLLHGNGGCRSGCLREAELAAGIGCPVLTLTFRTHGDSTGDLNDIGYGGRLDVIAAADWLAERHPGRRVVVWGQSLGAAAAVFAAPELGDRVEGYVLECPYRDLASAVRNRTRLHLPVGVEFVAYAGFAAASPLVLPHIDDISMVRAAGRIPPTARVRVLAGGRDTRATPDDARAVAAAVGPRAELVVIPEADHLKLFDADPAAYRAAVTGFIASAAGR